MNKVAIIILTYNCLEEASKPCLESIYAVKNEIPFEVVVVDNLSTDGTREYLHEFAKSRDNIKVLLNEDNYGYAAGNNLGIKSIEADCYILLNNDTLVTDHWIDKLINSFFENCPEVGMVGPVSNNVGNEQKIELSGLTRDNYEVVSQKYTQSNKSVYFETKRLGFFCVAIKRGVIDKIGLLDESFGIGMFEDDDYCLRAIQEGFKLIVSEGCFIYHNGGESFRKVFADKEYQKLFDDNKDLFNQKHNLKWLIGDFAVAYFSKYGNDLSTLTSEIRDCNSLNSMLARYNSFKYYVETMCGIEEKHLRTIDEQEKTINLKDVEIKCLQNKLNSLYDEITLIKSSLWWKIRECHIWLMNTCPTLYPNPLVFLSFMLYHPVLFSKKYLGIADTFIVKITRSILQYARKVIVFVVNTDKKNLLSFIFQRIYSKIYATKKTFLSSETFIPLLNDELIIFAGVPFDDVGGGQRSSQLARCAIKTGRSVYYVYAYPRYDFSTGAQVKSHISIPLLKHIDLAAISPAELFSSVSVHATVLFELPHPLFIPFLSFAKNQGMRTVYELIDDWNTSLGGDWFDSETHKIFVTQCDVVTGTAKILQDKLITMGRADAVYLPNAANENIFDGYKQYPIPSDYLICHNYKKRFLYFGSLYGDWFAWDYLRVAAHDNPDCGFFLIGDHKETCNLPGNVHFLGPKAIGRLPAYLMHADAALLPFTPGKISDAVSPIKVFEYIFMGKPVISTVLPEIEDYPKVLVARDEAEFSWHCKRLFNEKNENLSNDEFIAKNSWFSRLSSIMPATSERGKVSAIFLVHNNRDIIGRALNSLLYHCADMLKEVIVVDNLSTDGGGDYVRENYPNVTVLSNAVNGCSSGRNLALMRATAEYIAFFDSDQWFTSGSFITEAIAVLSIHTEIGAVGWAAGWLDKWRDAPAGVIADSLPLRGMDSPEAIVNGFRTDIAYLGTGGFIIPARIAQMTDGLDHNYDPTCFEDTDFSFQIKKLGFKLAYRDLTGIRHQPHQTTKAASQSQEYVKLFDRNARYFTKKWADYPDYFIEYRG